jgi:thiol-disulfide isomerase/thioredoxin
MNIDILTRLYLALGIVAGGILLYFLMNKFLLIRTRSVKGTLPISVSGKVAVLYFTTPNCAPCKTIQRPLHYAR